MFERTRVRGGLALCSLMTVAGASAQETVEQLSPDQQAVRRNAEAFVAGFDAGDATAVAALWAEFTAPQAALQVGSAACKSKGLAVGPRRAAAPQALPPAQAGRPLDAPPEDPSADRAAL